MIRLLLLASLSLYGQMPQSLQVSSPAPPIVVGGNANVVGNLGGSTYYYWVIAVYPIGTMLSTTPIVARQAPTTLSATNYVTIGWNGTGATSYTLLRTINPLVPSGTCTCKVVDSLVNGSYNNTSNTLTSYTVPANATAATGTLQVSNVFPTPILELQTSGVNAELLIGTLTLANGNGMGGPTVSFPGSYTLASDPSTGDKGFAGSGDLTQFGLSREGAFVGHVSSGGDTAITLMDQISGSPTILTQAYVSGQFSNGYQGLFTPNGFTFTAGANHSSFTLDDPSQLFTFNKTVDALNFKANGVAGLSTTVVVKGSAGNNCNLVFTGGLFTSTTCP